MHSQGNHQLNEKTTHRMGENICKWSNGQGINLPNIQTALDAQYQKMCGRYKCTILQRRHTDG